MKSCRIIRIFIILIFVLMLMYTEVWALGDWITEAEDFISDGSSEAGVTTGMRIYIKHRKDKRWLRINF